MHIINKSTSVSPNGNKLDHSLWTRRQIRQSNNWADAFKKKLTPKWFHNNEICSVQKERIRHMINMWETWISSGWQFKDSSDRSEHNYVVQTSNVIQNSKLISETVFLTIHLNLVQEKNSTNLLNHSRIV